MFVRLASLVTLAAALAWPAAAEDVGGAEILIDRRADRISVYLALPASELGPLFGATAGPLLGPDGTVDIEGLYEGTYLLADDIFAGARLIVGDRAVEVEALSMMVHDPEYLPGFADPYDAQVSIAVCTSPDTVRGMGLEDLRAYLGYFAWRVGGYETVEIVFPRTGRADKTFTVRDFVDFQLVGERIVTLPDGGVVTLQATAPDATDGALSIAALSVILMGLLLAALLIGRGAIPRPRDTLKGSP